MVGVVAVAGDLHTIASARDHDRPLLLDDERDRRRTLARCARCERSAGAD